MSKDKRFTMNMTIRVGFTTGTDIETAVKDAISFAIRAELAYTHFNFNGVELSIGQHADWRHVVSSFYQALDNTRIHNKTVVCI